MALLLRLTLISAALLLAGAPALAAAPAVATAPQPAGGAAASDAGPNLLDADPESLPTPPGLKEDQVLWATALESSFQLVAERGAGRKLLWQAVAGRFDEFLALRAKGEHEEAERAVALRQRLTAGYAGVYRAVTTIWGVDARLGCRSEAIDLEGAMRASGNAETPELRETRSRASQCATKARRGATAIHQANQVLQVVLAEAERLLVPPAAASPAASTEVH